MKNEDIAAKFKLGSELFEEGKFDKANRIFVQIVPKYRGKPQAEKLMYMYCKTYYETKDYYTSNSQMERFVDAYPKSEKVQELAFLAAKSYYKLSPQFSKDQAETVLAVEKLQNFINTYPLSEYLDQASYIGKRVRLQTRKKSVSISLYNTT